MKRQIPAADLRRRAREIAARAILRRASTLLGAARRSTHPLRLPYPVAGRGELAVDETLENVAARPGLPPRPEDLVVEIREERKVDAVLMVDTSLSMTGKNLALAGVAAAVLAWKLDTRDYSLVVFEGTATVTKQLGVAMTKEEAIGRLLEVPAMGFTNIEDALRKGLGQLERGRNRERLGILITDGVYTEGNDPLPLASRFPRLYVLMTEAYKMDRTLCQQMADHGRGKLFSVDSYSELPFAVSSLLREVLR